MASLEEAINFKYKLEDDNMCRSSSGYFHPQLVYSYKVYHTPLKIGDLIIDFSVLPKGPYRVTEIGNNSDGTKYARIKEIPYIEYLKKQGEHCHISQASFPFIDRIESILYNKRRIDNENFYKDVVFITRKGYMFSYEDVMNSENVGEERWPLKKYLPALINATEVYQSCTSFSKGIEFFQKLIMPSEIQIAKYVNNRLGFHINLNPESGYYWV